MEKLNCGWTDWKNGWDSKEEWTLSAGKVINGVRSEHSNKHEDRRFRYNICDAKIKVMFFQLPT